MRLGIIALVLIFVASGVKNLQDSGVGKAKKDGEQAVPNKYNRRKFGFAILMFVMGALVGLYYLVTL